MAAVGSVATAGQGDSARGGGQNMVPEGGGAGSTIAFTIEDNGDGTAKGQFQRVDRSGGTGQGGDAWHGTPLCLTVAGTMAKAIIERNDNQALYELFVQDNGQGAGSDPDLVTLTSEDTDPMCGEEDDDDDNTQVLGRGNVQVTDNP